ncbi:MAG: GntR family transcriptional regulator [Chloroflexota bacterium]
MARIAVGRSRPAAPAAVTVGPGAAARGPGRPQLRYERTIALVEDLITERGLAPGDLLPPGHEIARLADVSLISVRRALDELERSGRVVRHQGVGTFVGEPRIVAEPSRLGDLLATLGPRQAGETMETTLLSLERGTPDPAVARALDIGERDLVWHLVRLRRIGGRPRILERTALPVRLVAEVDADLLRGGGSLYALLDERYGLRASHEEQYLHVGAPTRDERRLLELHGQQPVVRLRGLSVTEQGTPFDCFEQVYPASDFVFYISGRSAGELHAAAEPMAWGVSPVPGGAPGS